MSPSALPPFEKFPGEGASVGRLLAGYSKLEIGLMNCVYMALDDFDAVLKAMFKPRGESLRINEAEKLGRVAYKALDLEADFLAAVEAMRHCLTIRNQYSHWIWWDDNSGMLAFANVEDIAKIENRVDNLGQLNPHHVTTALLGEQEAWSVYVDEYLAWVNYEGRFQAGKLDDSSRIRKPHELKRPALWVA
ncbi:MAG TPA: hypothetical protein VKG91_17880 [Roseiarcus sp.]|nr:hypothetical protein [Roseiarcus sp.]